MKNHWLYCVQAIGSQKVKIGTTNIHPNVKLAELQEVSAEPLILLGAKPFSNGIDVTNTFMQYCKEFAPYIAAGTGGWMNYPNISQMLQDDNWLTPDKLPVNNKIEAVPVKVQKPTYDKIKSYAGIVGKSAAKVIDEALTDWLDTVAESRIQSISEKVTFSQVQGMVN